MLYRTPQHRAGVLIITLPDWYFMLINSFFLLFSRWGHDILRLHLNMIALMYKVRSTRIAGFCAWNFPVCSLKKRFCCRDKIHIIAHSSMSVELQVHRISTQKMTCHSNKYLWHWQSRFLPSQTTIVSVDITIIFCRLSIFLSPLQFF